MNTYTSHVSLYDLLFLGTIFTGLNFALLLGFAKSTNRVANRFLSLALLVVVLWVTRLLGINMQLETYMPGWNRLPLRFLLALGPLIYFYVLKITRPEYKFNWKDLLHFSPALLDVANLKQLHPYLQLLVFISVAIYVYLSHRQIERFYQGLTFNEDSDRYRRELRWLHRLLAIFGMLWLLWIPYACADHFGYHDHLNAHVYYSLDILISITVIWIGATAFLRPELSAPANASASLKSSTSVELKQKAAWLKKIILAGRFYEDAELSLGSLAEKLNIHPHELSRIINIALKKNFNDFVNEYRVKDAALKMQDPAYDHLTLLGIAFESGFNSKSTFNRAFRQVTGKSAAEYKNELKKERPTYNLTRHTQLAAIVSYQQTIPQWSDEKLYRNAMFKNYFKIAFRGFWKQKLFTFINIIGLSIGISASLVIYLIVHYDFTFDKFHKDSDRIYRVVTNFTFQGNVNHSYGVTTALAPAIKSQVTGVEFTAPLYTLNPDVTVNDEHSEPLKLKGQDHITLADQGYFKIFNYTWLAGSSATMDEPYHVVLTSDRAKLYFPKLSYDQMIGMVITYDTLKTTVTGIVAPLEGNTDFSCHDFISYSSAAPKTRLGNELQLSKWGNTHSASEIFIKLLPHASAASVQKQVNAILHKNSPPTPDDVKTHSSRSLTVQPLSDIHFDQVYGTFDFSGPANKTTLYLLLAVAGFLLMLACINFINLTTAQAAQRAKEIGIRKTMGSSRKQLVAQFLSETFLVTLLAVIISIGLAPVILNLFSNFIATGVKADFIGQPGIFLFLLGLTVLVSFLAGFYPALMLSGYKPALVLKNQAQSNSHKTRNAWLRKSLTVSQFVIAQFFIMGTLLVSKQIYYALHKDLGFKKDAIIVVDSPFKHRSVTVNQMLENKLSVLPGVEMVSNGSAPPSSDDVNSTDVSYKDGKKEVTTEVEVKFADENYLKLYHIKILAGRNIRAGDTLMNLVVNEKYARTLGFTNPFDAIGKEIGGLTGTAQDMRIVGVTGDFYTHSVQSPISPVVILAPGNNNYQTGTFHIALKPETASGGDWQHTIASMSKVWKEAYPDDDFNYQFYDKSIEQFYTQEEHLSTLLTWCAGLSILISCLGLLGLAIYTTNQRTKEIGVRKVLGASVAQIVTLLSTELVVLIIVAFVIVTPLALLAMNKWEEKYADKTTISWWIFVASGAGMLLVAFVASSFQTIKAAIVNPVKSLRSE